MLNRWSRHVAGATPPRKTKGPKPCLMPAPATPRPRPRFWKSILEYRRELFHRAAGYVRGEILEATWLAFEMSTLQQNSIERTADFLAVSTGSVYAARSRVMRQIRNTVIRLENSDFWEEINHEHEPNRESL